jgi:hypothetical protein
VGRDGTVGVDHRLRLAKRGHRARRRRHEASIGKDRGKVARCPERDQRHARHVEVPKDRDHDHERARDVERRTESPHSRRDRILEEDDLEEEAGEHEWPPAEGDVPERGRPASQQQSDDQADRNGVEDEHRSLRVVALRRYGG